MSDVTDTSLGIEAHKRRGLLGDFFIRLVREKPLGTAGGLVVLVLLCAGIFADVLAPYPYAEIHLESILEGPSGQYLLGTDQLGRDVLSRIIYGARVSVIVGLAATTISVLGATALGGLCGFLGGKLDLIVQRLVDAWMAFPGLLLLLTIMSVVGRGMPQLIVVLGIIGWFGGSRVSRSAVIGIKENMYMMAAKSIGSPAWRTLIRHVLPNMLAPVIIMFTTGIGGVILAEASLSFLGYGLPPEVPSWGGMLSGEGGGFMEMARRL
ncbi:MAG: ABC transporter permease, partial [Dehalococcoidia bacterium]|nr:ABC transporter permease [Dehalococcoidia bacterium]